MWSEAHFWVSAGPGSSCCPATKAEVMTELLRAKNNRERAWYLGILIEARAQMPSDADLAQENPDTGTGPTHNNVY